MHYLRKPTLIILGIIVTVFTLHTSLANTPETSENEFQIVTSDLDRFRALIEVWKTAQPEDKVKLLEQLYLNPGSPGLKQFFTVKIRDKNLLAESLDRHLTYYEKLDIYDLDVVSLHANAERMFATFTQWDTDIKPIDIYLLAGRFSSAGTVYKDGVLIGSEQYADNPPSSLVEQGYKFSRTSALIASLAHEFVHSRQNQAGPPTLIRAAIFEGGADFLSETATGISPKYRRHYKYGLAHEKEVWQHFSAEMHGTDISNWIANKNQDEWPGDMGYYIGYQIAKAFYLNMPDKQEAYYHLTNVPDPAFVLSIGQYGSMLEQN